jgi:hypothetical protein
MKSRRAPYANRSVWYVVGVLSIVLVAGFAVGGYEINHLRTEVNGLHNQIAGLNSAVSVIYQALAKLAQQLK